MTQNFSLGDLVKNVNEEYYVIMNLAQRRPGPYIYIRRCSSDEFYSHVLLDANGSLLYVNHMQWAELVQGIESCV